MSKKKSKILKMVSVRLDDSDRKALKILEGTYPDGSKIKAPVIFRTALANAAAKALAAQKEGGEG